MKADRKMSKNTITTKKKKEGRRRKRPTSLANEDICLDSWTSEMAQERFRAAPATWAQPWPVSTKGFASSAGLRLASFCPAWQGRPLSQVLWIMAPVTALPDWRQIWIYDAIAECRPYTWRPQGTFCRCRRVGGRVSPAELLSKGHYCWSLSQFMLTRDGGSDF